MEFLTLEQVGKATEAEGLLCDRLRSSADELQTIRRVAHQASVFAEGVIHEDSRSAVVALEVSVPALTAWGPR